MSYIDDVFGPNGYLAAHFTGYTPRKGQVDLARAVDKSIAERMHLLAEAPTGTGKSIAYAVPAVYHATHGAERVVLVTANIALQEQLVNKDLPLLAKLLPWPFEFALMKGINNYLCVEQLETTMKKHVSLPIVGDAAKIAAWGATTSSTGDRSELPFEPDDAVWKQFSTTSDNCDGEDCKSYESCYAVRAKKKASHAQIVVVNYHLFFAHFKVLELTGGQRGILPPFKIAVLDEGHKTSDIARDCFDMGMGTGAIKWVGGKLASHGLVTRLENEGDKFFASVDAYRRSSKYKIRLREKNFVPWNSLHDVLKDVIAEYAHVLNALGDYNEVDRKQRAEIKKIEKRMRRAGEIIENITHVMNLEGDDVYFIEENKGRVFLCAKPVTVADRLKAHLFCEEKSTTVTSATLTANGGFHFVAGDLGVEKHKTLVAESPFSWSTQALLVLPQKGIPEMPTDPAFTQAAALCCAEVVRQAKGRTLCLFTSNRNMHAAYPHVLKAGYRVLRQGDMPRTQLIAAFKNDVNSVLMGVASFWAGVDVPGESLSCVFIDKLPFVTPEDPIANAVTERDPSGWFMKYSVPRAIIEFKQGFGRLIRTTTDRGVVVCCDRRIMTKFYGSLFTNSLPSGILRSNLIEDVGIFLDTGILIPKLAPSPPGGRSLFETL